ncbi:MAG: hypothetical protein GEV11_08540 [Streptosporangiales bacterium]|nr:hypothetical protein [Streptosporangiales bacterium]
MSSTTFARVVTGVAAAVFLLPGVWAFAAPRSFYEIVATFPPFNLHLFHDLGAFQLGVGAALLVALFTSDALLAGLAGGAAGTVVHAISHWLDQNLGGRPSDPWVLSALALVVVAALVVRLRAVRARA